MHLLVLKLHLSCSLTKIAVPPWPVGVCLQLHCDQHAWQLDTLDDCRGAVRGLENDKASFAV